MPQKYNQKMNFFVIRVRGRYGGDGTENPHLIITEGAPHTNQGGNIPETFPAWLGTTNGISHTVLRGYETYEQAERGERYWKGRV